MIANTARKESVRHPMLAPAELPGAYGRITVASQRKTRQMFQSTLR
jgi:hypothetical protein